jgi:hypothetical protein
MYYIWDLISIIGTLYVVYNSQILTYCFNNQYISNAYEIINQKIVFLVDFYIFISENNPLLLDYYDSDDKKEDDKKDDGKKDDGKKDDGKKDDGKKEDDKKDDDKKEDGKEKFEDKYLENFKKFPNEFYFDSHELEDELKEYERIKTDTEKRKFKQIREIESKLFKINEIEESGGISNDTDKMFTENLNNFGINKLLDYFDLQEDYEEDNDNVVFEELYMEMIKEKNILTNELKEIEVTSLVDDNFKEMARKTIIDKKVENFINDYILETTPMGNIYMRYNKSKGSFEYFSNNTIPYRYLETVGRKYVMTYWCKPLFIDTEEELKRTEIKYDEDIKKKEVEEKRKQEEFVKNPRNVLAKMKNYNKDVKNSTAMKPMKNRSSNNILPPQIKATIQNVNQASEKQLLKEKANRYTWEGRLTDYCPLKKIDKKVVDKSLSMTYTEFKRMQQEQQNKK